MGDRTLPNRAPVVSSSWLFHQRDPSRLLNRPWIRFTKQSWLCWLAIYLWYKAIVRFVFVYVKPNFNSNKKVRNPIYYLVKTTCYLKHHFPHVHFNKMALSLFQQPRVLRFFLALINFIMMKKRGLWRSDP